MTDRRSRPGNASTRRQRPPSTALRAAKRPEGAPYREFISGFHHNAIWNNCPFELQHEREDNVMPIRPYAPDDFLDLVKSFHGSVAHGILLGGNIVASPQKKLSRDRLYDAFCETPTCQPADQSGF
jgi:hypothetical protein